MRVVVLLLVALLFAQPVQAQTFTPGELAATVEVAKAQERADALRRRLDAPTSTPRPTLTPTNTPTETPTRTLTPSPSPSVTPSPTGTPQPVPTITVVATIGQDGQVQIVDGGSIWNLVWRVTLGIVAFVVFAWAMARVRKVI